MIDLKQKKQSSKTRKNRISFYGGFTFVEIMVVVAIILIMSSVVIVSQQATKSNAALKNSAREIAASIKLAQSFALQGKTQDNGGTMQAPCGYGFRFTADSGDTYQIYYNKLNSPTYKSCAVQNADISYLYYTGAHSTQEEFATLASGTATTNSSASTEIYFTLPSGKAFGSGGVEYAGGTITLKYNSTQSENITINRSGVTEEQ